MAVLSPKEIIHASASQQLINVDSGLQQQYFFRCDQGFQAHGAADHTVQLLSQQFQEDGLAVQMRILQTGAAAWLPVQHGCNWPVQALLEVSVYAAQALPDGLEVKVAVDAITDAQSSVIAHGGPLPLPLQRLLAPSTQHSRKSGSTAFAAPGDRRRAHVEAPQGRAWVRQLFAFPMLTFERHTNMRRVSLMFAATVEACGRPCSRATADVSATILRPSTVSVKCPEDALTALAQLGLPPDVYHRIFVRRGVLDVYADCPSPATTAALPARCMRGGFAELPGYRERSTACGDGRRSISGGSLSTSSDSPHEVSGRNSCGSDERMAPMRVWSRAAAMMSPPVQPLECAVATGVDCGRLWDRDVGAECEDLLGPAPEELDAVLDDLSPDLCDRWLAEMAGDGGFDGFI